MNEFIFIIKDRCSNFTQRIIICGVYGDVTVDVEESFQLDEDGCEILLESNVIDFYNIEFCDLLDEQLYILSKLEFYNVTIVDITNNCIFKNLENYSFSSSLQDGIFHQGEISFVKSKSHTSCCETDISCCVVDECGGLTTCCYPDLGEQSYIAFNMMLTSTIAEWEISKLEIDGISYPTGETIIFTSDQADFVNIQGETVLTNVYTHLANMDEFSAFTFEPCIALSEPSIFSGGGQPIPSTKISYPTCQEWCIAMRPTSTSELDLDAFEINQDGYVSVDGSTDDTTILYYRGAKDSQNCTTENECEQIELTACDPTIGCGNENFDN
jgi:hypothetical protein